jgi:hypothetical protein
MISPRGTRGKGMGLLMGRWCLRCLALAGPMDKAAARGTVRIKTAAQDARES